MIKLKTKESDFEITKISINRFVLTIQGFEWLIPKNPKEKIKKTKSSIFVWLDDKELHSLKKMLNRFKI